MLLIGPAGSGKTTRVLSELEAALGRGQRACLVAPTASMAEHLQHQMARRGLVVSPRTILPLAGLVADLTPGCREVSPALEILLVERALARAATGEFAAVAGYPGFHTKLLDTMQEFWAAGAQPARLPSLLPGPPATAFARVMAEFETLLREAGAMHRAERLRLAAEALQQQQNQKLAVALFDGFFNFTPVELELLRAVVRAAEKIVVTLPDSGAEEARRALVEMGMPEQQLAQVYRPSVAPVVVQAATPEREIEHIAGRILADHQASGRPFQEYGVILRAPEIYAPIVEAVFERFGIPFRSPWPRPLAGHSSIRFLAGLLRLADTGFDGAETLEVLKLAGSGIGLSRQIDRYEFRLREALPGQGVEFLRAQAAKLPQVEAKLEQLGKLADWAGATLTPQVWTRRAAGLARAWFHPPEITDGVAHEKTLEWRRLAEALQAWAAAAEEAADVLRLEGVERASLQRFRAALEAVLRLTLLRAPDRRRNVVQVLSVYEARQWELPVVFVCGLAERQFPRYHSQNLFFPDAQRRRLAASGLRLSASADLDREERFLFDLATTRATDQLYLTYPTHEDAGAETLRSFFLEPWTDCVVAAERVRVKEGAGVAAGGRLLAGSGSLAPVGRQRTAIHLLLTRTVHTVPFPVFRRADAGAERAADPAGRAHRRTGKRQYHSPHHRPLDGARRRHRAGLRAGVCGSVRRGRHPDQLAGRGDEDRAAARPRTLCQRRERAGSARGLPPGAAGNQVLVRSGRGRRRTVPRDRPDRPL
jgi:ATP-dependent helicase/DNAse subunit B